MAFLQSSWIILFSDKLIAKPEIAIVYAWNQSTMVCIFLLTHEMSYDFKGMRNITFAYTKLFFFGLEIMKKKRLQVLLQFFLSKIVILSGTFLTFMKFKELINSAKIFHVRTKITSLIQQIPTSFLYKLIGRFRNHLRHLLNNQFCTPHPYLNQFAKMVQSKLLVC